MLIQQIAGDRELVHGEFLAPGGVVRVKRRWEEIAAAVNAVPRATVQKNGEQWKEVYTLQGNCACLIAIYCLFVFVFFSDVGCSEG